MDVVARIPAELLTEVFKYLSAQDLTSCAHVCPYWNELAHQFQLWARLYRDAISCVSWLDGPLARLVECSRIEECMIGRNTNELELKHCVDMIENFFQRLNMPKLDEIERCPVLKRSMLDEEHQCTMLGPAIDQPDFSEAFFRALLRWVDVEMCGRFLSENVPVRGSTNSGWAGLGLPLRLPSAQDGNSFRLIILHARDKATRATLPYGGNRVVNSSLLTTEFGDPNLVQLTQEALCTIRQSSSIVYTIDLRAPEEQLIWTDPTPEERWMQMRRELNAITSVMTKHQKLLVLGLYASTEIGHSVHYQPYEVIRKLGGTVHSDHDVQPLINRDLVWRTWCASADPVNANYLEKIFSWLVYEEEHEAL